MNGAPKMQMMENGSYAGSRADKLMAQQEGSPAYQALKEQGLLETGYRISTAEEIEGFAPNSSMWGNTLKRACLCAMGVLPGIVDSCYTRQFSVSDGNVRCGRNSSGIFFFFLPGVHRVADPFTSVDKHDTPLTQKEIINGNRSVITIDQGFIGLCLDRGQPVLLPPGMHQWKSDTMKFEKAIDLAQHVIRLGPYTLITVDEGYAAITSNNGMQTMLEGGKMHMLTHRNWKFEKFMTMKIQTNDLKEIRATTGDNVLLETQANVNWCIKDVALAAKMAAETMKHDGKTVQGEDISKLREDVLKQCTASLSAFVGSIRYSDSMHVSATTANAEATQPRNSAVVLGQPVKDGGQGTGMAGAGMLFDKGKLRSAVAHANDVCLRYGVEVMSINIISAFPKDLKLVEALAAGAVAAAEAEQAETAAEGSAKALMIRTKAEADAKRIAAEAEADSDRIRAEGSKDAGDMIEQSGIATELARIQKTGEALSDKQSFFFGASAPGQLPAILSNSGLVPGIQVPAEKPKSTSIWG